MSIEELNEAFDHVETKLDDELERIRIQQERELRASKCMDPWEAMAIRQGLVWV